MHIPKQHHHLIIIILAVLVIALISALSYIFYLQTAGNPETRSISEVPNISNPADPSLEAPTSQFLSEEEAVLLEVASSTATSTILPVTPLLFEYVEIIDSCGVNYKGKCLNVRSGPGTEYPVVNQLRNGIVLKVDGKVSRDGEIWYKIIFDEELRYPERVTSDWYVAAEYTKILLDEGEKTTWQNEYATTSKKIVVDCSEQALYAYEANGELFMHTDISTGLALTPTPKGEFTIYKKIPSRYMQGPLPGLPSDQYYDMPGVPWNLYFTKGGAVIHGTYWHDSFGEPYSHGCVNMPVEEARTLYNWAPLGTEVIVRD